MERKRRRQRRTGVIFLVLIAATNVIVWMEPFARARVAGETAETQEILVGLTSCLLAAALAATAWQLGRRSIARRPAASRARARGLRLSVLCALMNLAFVGAILVLAPAYAGPASEILLVAAVWYLLLLPLQLVASYAMGRGSSAGGRRADDPRPILAGTMSNLT